MTVFIRGTQKQLVRFAEEAGVSAPNPKFTTQANLTLMARNSDTMMDVFTRVFDNKVYTPHRPIRMKKVDKELSDIYRTLLVKCSA